MKGLSFSEPMVKAWLEGRKTVTRRLISNRLLEKYYDYDDYCNSVMPRDLDIPCSRAYEKQFFLARAPYLPGETVYIKETWRTYEGEDDSEYTHPSVEYKTDSPLAYPGLKWKSPRFMPEWASRSKAEIVSVRPERLQEITDEEIAKEGIDVDFHSGDIATAHVHLKNKIRHSTARECFRSLWETLRPGTWEQNSWVWRIELEKVEVKANG